MPAANVIQLRQLLADKFPGLRTYAEKLSPRARNCWATGLPQIDELSRGGLPRGGLSEVVVELNGCGGALLLASLLGRAAQENQLAALVDGSDSFDVTQVEEKVLSRLLWVRCRAAEEAMKAADLLLRDGNLPLVVLDLALNPAAQLRRISATTWYRLQRIVEQTSTVCVVFTPRAMISPAQTRIALRSRFSLSALEREPAELLRELQLEISGTRRLEESEARFA